MTLAYQLLVIFTIITLSENTCDFPANICSSVQRGLRYVERNSCHGSPEVETESSYIVGGTVRTRLGETVRHARSFFQRLDYNTFQSCLTGNYSFDYLCNTTPIDCGPTDQYRSFDGSCNNINHPDWGKVGTEQLRLIDPDFDDGFSSPRSRCKDGTSLPNPRVISNKLHHEIEPDEDPHFTMLVWSFGQLIDHDVVLSPVLKDKDGGKINCCDDQQHFQCASACKPITIPEDDPHFSKMGQRCMNFVRSVSSPCCSKHCKRTPINLISAQIDGNPTYGNNDQEAANFRVDGPTGKGAKLRVASDFKLEGYHLPRADNQTVCEDGSPTVPFCSVSGDNRHHVVPSMISTVTLFLREHNRVVDKLKALNNPGWDDERLYQEARKIVIAEYQKLTMEDFLEVVLDKKTIDLYNLGKVYGYHNTYNKDVNPQSTVSFSTAAFRFGHSLVNAHQGQRDKENSHTTIEELTHLHYNKANMSQVIDGVSGILRYLGHQCMGKADGHFTAEVRNLLFPNSRNISLDLCSVNIMRGRDHGLPSYTEWRRFYKLSDFPSAHEPEVAAKILALYNYKPEDIDLFVGAMTEKKLEGALVGELFAHMLAEQFWRLRAGDRYFFQNEPDAQTAVGRFKKEDQVKSIQKITLARLICDNTETVRIQPDVFVKVGPGNELKSCTDKDAIPDIDFSLWHEY